MTTPTPDPTPAAPAPSNTLRTVLLIGGSIVLVIVLAVVALQVSLRLNRTDASDTVSVSESFDSIEIISSAADVTVEYDDVDDAVVEFEQGDSLRSVRFEHEVRSGVLEIEIRDRGWFPWDWSFGGEGSELTVTLPESLASTPVGLSVDSTAGNIVVEGEFGDVDVATTAGNLELTGGATALTLESTAGNVEVLDYELEGDLRSESTAGNGTFDLTAVPSSVRISSTAGNIDFTVPTGSYRVETDVAAGAVSSQLSSDADASSVFSFETTAGNIDLRAR